MMNNIESLLEFTETLIYRQENLHCNGLQRGILRTSLREEGKTYEELACEYGYSTKYVKYDVAPKLWQILSQALGEKVTPFNARTLLTREMQKSQPLSGTQVAPPTSPTFSPLPVTAPITPSSQPSTSPSTRLPRARILLVDDEPKNLRLLSEILEEQGSEVYQVIEAESALQAISTNLPDLILLDIMMPGLDGYTLCQMIKANPQTQDIPIIFVTALDEPWSKVQAFSLGSVDYISKPFKLVEVVARVENQLKIQQLQQELKAQNAQFQKTIQELQRLAAIDSLTQLWSRHRFDEYLLLHWYKAIIAKTSLTLIFCEIDNRDHDLNSDDRGINQQVLVEVAQMLKRIIEQPEALIARYEDTTFGIILPNVEISTSELIAQTLIKQVQQVPIPLQDSSINSAVSLRMGIALVFPHAEIEPETLSASCAHSLHQAKTQGRSFVVHIEPSSEDEKSKSSTMRRN